MKIKKQTSGDVYDVANVSEKWGQTRYETTCGKLLYPHEVTVLDCLHAETRTEQRRWATVTVCTKCGEAISSESNQAAVEAAIERRIGQGRGTSSAPGGRFKADSLGDAIAPHTPEELKRLRDEAHAAQARKADGEKFPADDH